MTSRCLSANEPNQAAYERYIGGISPRAFVGGYLNAEEAVTDFLANYQGPDEEEIPSSLHDSLVAYIESSVDDPFGDVDVDGIAALFN